MFELLPFGRETRKMISYDPFSFNEFFSAPARAAGNMFRADVIDNGDSFELNAELPGINRDDISITLQDDNLIISAEQKKETDSNDPNFVLHERYYGSYRRSFALDGIDVDAISASYTDGVLRVILPKLAAQKPEARQIEIA